MRTFVIGDIHGAPRAVEQLFQRAKITPKDQIIFLGDYADGWSQTPELIELLMQIQQTHKAIFLRGNHDDLCLQFLQGKQMDKKWLQHGGGATQKAYQNRSEAQKKAHAEFLSATLPYYLDGENRLFLHAGFTNLKGVDFEYFEKLFFWDRTLWELALATAPDMPKNDIFFPKRLSLYTEIFIGHTPTTRYGESVPMQRHGVWNVDTGAAFGGRLTAMEINTKEFWQSDPVSQLYPNEAGRTI